MATLIKELMPEPDIEMRHVRGVDAPPERVFAALSTADFGKSRLVSLLFALRGVPALLAAPRETLERMKRRMWRLAFTSRPIVGSSRYATRGRCRKVAATSQRMRCPRLSVRTGCWSSGSISSTRVSLASCSSKAACSIW